MLSFDISLVRLTPNLSALSQLLGSATVASGLVTLLDQNP